MRIGSCRKTTHIDPIEGKGYKNQFTFTCWEIATFAAITQSMSKDITFLINRSELTAGTRGASLGPDAIFTAARALGNPFFSAFKMEYVEDENYRLDQTTTHRCAKYIDGLKLVHERISEKVNTALLNDTFPFVLAGDHGSAAGTIAGIKKAYPDKRLGVIWIDAHGDLHTPFTTPTGNMHGMPLAIALGIDNLDSKLNNVPTETDVLWQDLKNVGVPGTKIKPEDLVFIAVRDIEPEEDHLLKTLSIRNYTVEEVNSLGTEAIIQKALDRLKECDMLYISFDVDSMDPKATSYGTGTPVRNGLMPKQAKELLKGFKQSPKTVCMEVVEVNPCLDEKLNRMAEVAFDLIQAVARV
jgi:arginase